MSLLLVMFIYVMVSKTQNQVLSTDPRYSKRRNIKVAVKNCLQKYYLSKLFDKVYQDF